MELKLIANRSGQLSSFLRGELKMSTGLMNKLKWGDAIQVNGVPQFTNFPVSHGDVITVQLDEPAPEYPPEDGPLTILYEDDHILLVDKPAGMLIHPSRSQNSGTLANYALGYFQKTRQRSAFHPVTRLDRDTFGIVLLAKNAHIHNLLQETPIQKTYHALTFGGPTNDCGTIDAPIARRPLPSLLRFISPDGKPSVTAYRVLERGEEFCELELRPITGRTHQLRLHCAHMGFPILGDPQYTTPEATARCAQLGLTTQLLCAKSLRFVHPITGTELFMESRLNAEMQK